MTTKKKSDSVEVVIKHPNMLRHTFHIKGLTPYVQCKFSAKSRQIMRQAQEAGSRGKNTNKNKAPKDFDDAFQGAIHYMGGGGYGIPAAAFRNAMISACRVAGAVMTKAKLSVFVEPDGYDEDDDTPLVRLHAPDPEILESHVRIDNGKTTDIRVRPIWRQWEAFVKCRWDGDQFSPDSMANLLMRAGLQVGVGEGRHDSKTSSGQGWGEFEVVGDE